MSPIDIFCGSIAILGGAIYGLGQIITRRAYNRRRTVEGKEAVAVGKTNLLIFTFLGAIFILVAMDANTAGWLRTTFCIGTFILGLLTLLVK